MVHFAAIFLAFSTLLCAVTASPVAALTALEKREKHGRGTWYDTGLGACGWTNVNSDKVIALSPSTYAGGSHCKSWIKVTNTATGASAWGEVADECPGCGPNDLDMTPGLFEKLGSLDQGVLSIEWEWAQ